MVQNVDSAGTKPELPTQTRLAALWAATIVALALHNAEEWLLGLTGWIAAHPWMPGRSLHGDQAQFGLALLLVTAAVVTIAVIAVSTRAEWSAEALACVAYALLINAGSHLVISVASWSLMPGVISGLFILLPLGLIIVRTLPPVRWTVSTVVMTVIAAVAIVMGSLLIAATLAPIISAIS
ncbi:HXXEE domain-containing protein [Microbacterium sp. A82]|uniref:HXXEE domain-containing protein n=1 Tax=Microbacterium sp. A82 TaxID=3450452 RepID=UPI003F3B72CB